MNGFINEITCYSTFWNSHIEGVLGFWGLIADHTAGDIAAKMDEQK